MLRAFTHKLARNCDEFPAAMFKCIAQNNVRKLCSRKSVCFFKDAKTAVDDPVYCCQDRVNTAFHTAKAFLSHCERKQLSE